jgi:hypothetical protein
MRKFKIIITFQALLLLVACNQSVPSLLSTYNKSTYSLSTASDDSPKDSVKVNVSFNFSDPETSENPVQIVAGCEKFNTTENEIEFKIGKSDMPFQFIATSIGYFSIETAPIITKEVDSISIEVNFAEDDRPMVHCEEANFTQKGNDADC